MSDTTITTETPVEGVAPEVTSEEAQATPNDVANATTDPEPEASEEDTEPAEEDVEDSTQKEEPKHGDEKLLKQLRRKNAENKTLRERAVTAERKLLQREVADEVGLPSGMAARLVGDTREALAEDAKSLLAEFERRNFAPGAVPSDGLRRGDVRAIRPEDETDLGKIGNRIYER